MAKQFLAITSRYVPHVSKMTWQAENMLYFLEPQNILRRKVISIVFL